MKTTTLNHKNKLSKFPLLFGSQHYNDMPMFIYAENLLMDSWKKSIENYSGGFQKFIIINNDEKDVGKQGFIPLIDKDGYTKLSFPFNSSGILTYKGASLVVWFLVLEQMATKANDDVMERVYTTIDYIKKHYNLLTDENGKPLFTNADIKLIDTIVQI